jgi:hypothetical protein
VLRLEGGDVRDGGEDIAGVSGSSLNAVSVVDATLAGLGVDVKVLQVVVEVHGAGAEVSAEKGGVCGEDGRDINAALLAEWQGDTSKPLMKVSNDSLLPLVTDKLGGNKVSRSRPDWKTPSNYLSQEPGDKITENDSLVGLVVVGWRRDTGQFPQIRLPLIHPVIGGLGVDEDNPRRALDQPAAVDDANSPVLHGLHGGSDLWAGGLHLFHLDSSLTQSAVRDGRNCAAPAVTYRLVVKRADESVSLAIFSCCDGGLGLDDRVDTTNWSRIRLACEGESTDGGLVRIARRDETRLTSMSYLSSNLKEKVVLDVASLLLAFGTHCVFAV